MIQFLCIVLLGFAYRLRGGGWNTGLGNTLLRLIWGACLAVVFFGILGIDWFDLAIIPLAFLSMMIPHATYQNMGTWPTPQKSWVAFFLPTYTAIQWTALPMFARTLNDFIGMMMVGFYRGLVVFGMFAGLHVMTTGFALIPMVAGILSIALLQPTGYLLGRFFPVTLGASLPARSACYGEFFNGIAWALAVLAYGFI